MIFEKTKKGLTKSGFLSFWNYAAVVDPRAVVEGALYSGLDATEQVILDTFFEDDCKTIQGTLYCHSESCRDSSAVSALLAGLVNAASSDVSCHSGAVGVVTADETDEPYDRYLALDFAVDKRPSVAAFLFDWATVTVEQFSALIEAMTSVASARKDTIPCVLIGLNEKSKDAKLLAFVEESCEKLHIPQPTSVAEDAPRAVYVTLVKAALSPEHHIPETPSLIATKRHRRLVARATMYAGVGCIVGAGCFLAYRTWRSSSSGSRSSSR